MKRLIAILCLAAVCMTGCKKDAAPQKPTEAAAAETTFETQPQTTPAQVEIPEQVVQQQVSPLVGSWEATMDVGKNLALLYYLRTDGDEEMALQWLKDFENVSYPLQVCLELNEDGTYMYTRYADTEGTSMETFAEGLYNGYVAYYGKLNGTNEQQTKEFMADNGFAFWDINSKIKEMNLSMAYLQQQETGTWEQNDQGLVLSGWCTVKFTVEDGTLVWNETDDEQMINDEVLPLTFTKN